MPGPITPEEAGLITAGSSVGGSLINAGATVYTNQQNLKYARESYDKQKADNLAQWHLQNEYNSPQAQMARLRAAGLNPNLVYGNGATTTAGSIGTTAPQNFRAEAPQLDIGRAVQGGLSTYYDTQIKEATIDNLRAQNTNILQEGFLKAATIANMNVRTQGGIYDNQKKAAHLPYESDIAKYSADLARESLRQRGVQTEIMIQKNEREKLLMNASLKENAERILNYREQRLRSLTDRQKAAEEMQNLLQIRTNLGHDDDLKMLDLQLKKKGIQPSDPIYLRIISRLIDTGEVDPSIDYYTGK